ncbi:MAG: lipase family protein [Deltaproteobacteria bacterium]|nr:lipase family protein [Deltaproteobacteria bacterium]
MAKIQIPWGRFEPDWSSGHSHEDALALALASTLAYRPTAQFAGRLGAWGFGEFQPIEVRKGVDIDTTAFVASNDEVVLVSFRGSASAANWVANLQAVKEPGPLTRTRVHEGFQDSMFPALLETAESVYALQRAGQGIWVTGHSLGGALASLFAAMMLEQGTPIDGLYTFGAPRVGNRRFRDQLNDRLSDRPHFRYANHHDLIPHLPPEPFFHHAGERRLLRPNAGPSASTSLWLRFKKTFGDWFNEITDSDLVVKDFHLLDTDVGYLPRLVRAAGG